MLVTLNQKEIEGMIIDGLTRIGIIHEATTAINLVAGRSPNGITAEIKLVPKEVVVAVPTVAEGARASFSGGREHPAPEAMIDEPSKMDEESVVTKEDDISEPEDDTSLFDK